MEKVAGVSEELKNADSAENNNLKSDMPDELKVNDLKTVKSKGEKLQTTAQEKLEVISNEVAVMNENIARAKEELMSLDNIFNELYEKFASKSSLEDDNDDTNVK